MFFFIFIEMISNFRKPEIDFTDPEVLGNRMVFEFSKTKKEFLKSSSN